jgi:hypothetical protein
MILPPQQVFTSTVKEPQLREHVTSKHSAVSFLLAKMTPTLSARLSPNQLLKLVRDSPQKSFEECFPSYSS